MGSLLIRPVQSETGKILGIGLKRLGSVPPGHYHIREICWDGTENGVAHPVLKGLLVGTSAGREKDEFVSALIEVLATEPSPYRPFVLAWSATHSAGCDRSGGGSCTRCEAGGFLRYMHTRAATVLGAADAYHEAGHAVVGFSLGMQIEETTLIPYGSAWGWTLPQYFEELGKTEFLRGQPQLAKAYAVSLLAGPMSQARYRGLSTSELAQFSPENMEPLGGKRDFKQWSFVARALQLGDDWWAYCRSEVLHRFESPAICSAIDLVSEQLQQGKHFRNGALKRSLEAAKCPVIYQT